MAEWQLDGLLLTAMDNLRYFIGIDSTFWESYTRPWLVLVPASGNRADHSRGRAKPYPENAGPRIEQNANGRSILIYV
ncbi:hypothetical protein [Mesorhizobium sp. M0955]|uniref:hypothetical protein n=1 Tax=Mesorhizobium sp. M0955 TaxID=2957033 RepID=UPI00333C2B92